VIVLRAKNIAFDVTYIDLRNKPDWFLAISPHGKVPVLQVGGSAEEGGQALFESNAIAEFLEDAEQPHLHPEDLLQRARNRAWTDFVPTFAGGLSALYYASSEDGREERFAAARQRLGKLEAALAERENPGPYFNGPELSLVDAAYAPFLQRFRHVDRWLQSGLLQEFEQVSRWADALGASDVVSGSVPENFFAEFNGNMQRRGFLVGQLMAENPEVSAG
jgi:glutathione S-transferase